jgi:poly(glycerol-phosphate) alpha-glucosyltransferase
MKIACIIDSMSRNAGGLYTSVRRLMQEVAKVGYDSRIFAMRDEYTEADLSGWDPVPVTLSTAIGPRRFGFAPGLDGRLREFAPDLVQTHGLWTYTSWVSQQWHRRTGGPCFIHPHGMLDPWAVRHSSTKKRFVASLFENRHLREAGCMRALCVAEAEAIRAYGIPAPVAIIPNGIDLPEDEPMLPKTEPKMLLYLGRVHPKKGLPLLMEAWAACGSKDWQLVIAGWDEKGHEDELKRQCWELGVPWRALPAETFLQGLDEDPGAAAEANVTFVGSVYGEAKDALLRRASGFVLPSFSEGLPMTVLEAWAYRLPVVMTDPCNLPEGFAAGAALRVETEAASVAAGLAELFAMSEGERVAMGEAGRALVEKRFLWPAIATQVAEVHEWLLGGGPRPGCVGG